jgi:hypothetical protein
MKRILGALMGSAVLALSITGVASAAATPVVNTAGATKITTTTAVLTGTVNARGVATDYTFNYGPTPAYGTTTVARSAGSGTRPVEVTAGVAGLLPGTVYHVQIAGQSAAGASTGADVTFKTKGAPPSAVVTGPTGPVFKQQALITGTVNPNGATTTWAVQYGKTTAYGLQTTLQTLPPGTAPVSVSSQLTALAPATLFHYRIVAFHGATETDGADGTFFTQPNTPPAAGLKAFTNPGKDAKKPFTFTTSGSLNGGHFVPAGQRCSGTVGIRYYNGKHQLAFVVATVGSDCRYSGSVSFSKTGGKGKGKVHLRVTVSYRGNGYLAAQNKVDHVTVGK